MYYLDICKHLDIYIYIYIYICRDQVPGLYRDWAAADGPARGVELRHVPPPRPRAGRHHAAELSPLPHRHQRAVTHQYLSTGNSDI